MKKPLFIHIPKAGGTSIIEIIRKYNKDHPEGGHIKATTYPKEYRDSCFVFSFVRNPYDRLSSAHKYLTGGYGNKADVKFGKTLSLDFKYFVKHQLKNNMNWQHFLTMVYLLNDDIDFIGKVENFQQDFDIICDKIGIPQQQLPHINKSNHKSNHKHYTEYYDDETRQTVSEIYAEDIERFGYKFEQ